MKKRSFEKERKELIENSRKNNTQTFFGRANKVKLGFKRRTTMIIGDDGTLFTENVKIADAFKKMFKTLLNQPSRNTTIEKRASVGNLIIKFFIKNIV
jgi:hypothetical protein